MVYSLVYVRRLVSHLYNRVSGRSDLSKADLDAIAESFSQQSYFDLDHLKQRLLAVIENYSPAM